MKISKQARRNAKQLFRNCVVSGLLDETRVRNTVSAVIGLKPRNFLATLEYFRKLVKWDMERHSARIETVVSLAPNLQAELQASLARRYGPGLQFSFLQNPQLIGGARIQVGSDVFDGSIRARLAALKQRF